MRRTNQIEDLIPRIIEKYDDPGSGVQRGGSAVR